MASELIRGPPPALTRKSSGSRPPTSRFQEGSMNDRASAAPPVQFLGPEQLKSFESQFYPEQPAEQQQQQQHEAARGRKPERPLSTPTQLLPLPLPGTRAESENGYQRTVTHKKSTGFFGRVRDVLFNRGGGGNGGGGGGQQQGTPLKLEEVGRKHTSLQEPLQQNAPPARPDYLKSGRTQSEINVSRILSSPRGVGGGGGGGSDRPSREDILASYNELVASGFFQSHAIQSTRHVAPRASALPVIEGSPRPPVRVSSIHGMNSPGRGISESPAPMQGRFSREYLLTAPRPILSYAPSAPDLKKKDSRYTFQSRKRTRGDVDDAASPDPQSAVSSSASYFALPLKRVAKKLRQMPSLTIQTTSPSPTVTLNTPDVTDTEYNSDRLQQASHQTGIGDVVRLAPCLSPGGTLHATERPIRLRSPSPGGLETTPTVAAAAGAAVSPAHNVEQHGERVVYRRAAAPAIVTVATTEARRPRRTFSYTVRESSRGRTRATERDSECRRECDYDDDDEEEANWSSYKLDCTTRTTASSSLSPSGTRSHSKPRVHNHGRPQLQPQPQLQTQIRPQATQNALAPWQSASLGETTCHRDSFNERMRRGRHGHNGVSAEERLTTTSTPSSSPSQNNNRSRSRSPRSQLLQPPHQKQPLQVLPDANRGIPAVPKLPERWHGTGKAYHLKDRGSRPELQVTSTASASAPVRRSEDSGCVVSPIFVEKENNHPTITTTTIKNPHVIGPDGYEGQFRGGGVVDADGDIDMVMVVNHSSHARRGRSRSRIEQQQEQQQQEQNQHHYWHIGNAL
ncbi:hypothetical protein F5Y17DRAFT_14707 [Xylariaceae sp. FL0594]|nr:hypothetical protein F5Y17DRAFT_14707 [Xylariaceae sp. FL0594]